MITWYRVCLGMESAGRPRSIYTVGVAVNSGEIAATVTMFLICVHKSLRVFAKQSRLLKLCLIVLGCSPTGISMNHL